MSNFAYSFSIGPRTQNQQLWHVTQLIITWLVEVVTSASLTRSM